MISINKLKVFYKKDEFVLDDLNLEIEQNKIHGIVGMNGSGKTTLLNSIFGLIDIYQGEILFENQKLLKKQIAFLPTENHFYSYITAREYLNLFSNKNFDLEQWNLLFKLPLDKIIDSFSTGMKKKLAFLGILKMDKPLIILDEPFNGIDMETGRIIRAIILKLKEKNKTIIVTSHIIETLTNMCDYIHYLNDKKIEYSVDKNDFNKFEEEIFSSIEDKNKTILDDLI